MHKTVKIIVMIITLGCLALVGYEGYQVVILDKKIFSNPIDRAVRATDGEGSYLNVHSSGLGKKGVYYNAIDSSIIKRILNSSNGTVDYHNGYLWFDNRMYSEQMDTYSKLPSASTEKIALLGKKLADVYGNHEIVWSTERADLQEVTHQGELFKVSDAEPTFRVVLVYNRRGTIVYRLYESLNNITLVKGSDLYRKMLHFDQAVTMNGKMIEGDSICKSFLEAIYNSDFLEESEKLEKSLARDKYKLIEIRLQNGIVQNLEVHNEGYVVMQGNSHIFCVNIGKVMVREIYRWLRS